MSRRAIYDALDARVDAGDAELCTTARKCMPTCCDRYPLLAGATRSSAGRSYGYHRSPTARFAPLAGPRGDARDRHRAARGPAPALAATRACRPCSYAVPTAPSCPRRRSSDVPAPARPRSASSSPGADHYVPEERAGARSRADRRRSSASAAFADARPQVGRREGQGPVECRASSSLSRSRSERRRAASSSPRCRRRWPSGSGLGDGRRAVLDGILRRPGRGVVREEEPLRLARVGEVRGHDARRAPAGGAARARRAETWADLGRAPGLEAGASGRRPARSCGRSCSPSIRSSRAGRGTCSPAKVSWISSRTARRSSRTCTAHSPIAEADADAGWTERRPRARDQRRGARARPRRAPSGVADDLVTIVQRARSLRSAHEGGRASPGCSSAGCRCCSASSPTPSSAHYGVGEDASPISVTGREAGGELQAPFGGSPSGTCRTPGRSSRPAARAREVLWDLDRAPRDGDG